MNLATLLARHSRSRPNQTAIFYGINPWASFEEWAQRSYILAEGLRSLGLKSGDRVALFMRNHPRYLELLLACWWGGLVAVPINARLHIREVEWIIDHAQAKTVFVTGDVAPYPLQGTSNCFDIESDAFHGLLRVGDTPIMQQPPAELQPETTAWLFYTSGTTGRPKGVEITHRNLLTMGMGYFADVDAITRSDKMVYAAPMSHGAGLYCIPHLIAGAQHVVPESGGFNSHELYELGNRLGPLTTFAPPTIVNRLVDFAEQNRLPEKTCASVFKTIIYGGAPMYLADIERALRVMGPRFVQIYGQGETPMVTSVLRREEFLDQSHPSYFSRLASVGIPQTPVEVRVVDKSGLPLGPGEIGEVVVRGETVMKGYWSNPDATKSTIRDGWLFTGDMGVFDADGFLTLKDRSKDLIISGGANIYPREVEEVLLTEPSVAEVAVVGVADKDWGEVVVAFVVTKPGKVISFARLDACCLASIARFKRPKHYRILDSLPKNNYGKVLKTKLREMFAESLGS